MARILTSLFLSAALLAVAGCGVDGGPERPTRAEQPDTGISITGRVAVGISGGS